MLALFTFFAGVALFAAAWAGVRHLVRTYPQRAHDRRVAREQKAFWKDRMRNAASSSRELTAQPWAQTAYPDAAAHPEAINPRRSKQ